MKALNALETVAVTGSSHMTWEPGFYAVDCDIFGFCVETYTEGYYRYVSDAEELVDIVALSILGLVVFGALVGAVLR